MCRLRTLALVIASICLCAGTTRANSSDPQIDLLMNRYLWHLHRAGPVFPLASEGLRKYSQEYDSPWGESIRHDGVWGRRLLKPRATLKLPWQGDTSRPVQLRLLVAGLADDQKVSIAVNQKNVGNLDLAPAWQQAEVDLPAGILRRGENEIRFTLQSNAQVEGGSTWGLFNSLTMDPAGSTRVDRPPLTPVQPATVAGVSKPALVGFRKMEMYVEIPEGAILAVTTGSEDAQTRFRVSAVSATGKVNSLLDHPGGDGWHAHRLSLAGLGGQLVRLVLEATGPNADQAAWAEAAITLPAVTSRDLPRYRNAVLLVVDALRSDRLAIYGKTRVLTPRITAESGKRGAVFLHNQAASPSSPPSHGSIQTGMIPRVHGVVGDKSRLTRGTPMISTQLGDAGFATAYFGNNSFGMGRLEKPGRWTEYHEPNREKWGIDCSAVIQGVLGFAKKQSEKGRRFFISALPYETHTPYRFHPGITERYHPGSWGPPVGKLVDGDLLTRLSTGRLTLTEAQWSQLHALYDGEVERMDRCFGDLIDGLAEQGRLSDTLVVLTSDHGEGLFEHGKMGHAFGHFAELSNVPLVFFGDGLVPSELKVDVVTGHVDIAPTLLELLGVDASPRIQGLSLTAIMARAGRWPPRVVSLEYGRSFALRTRHWKYIVDYDASESLYHLRSDPGEKKRLEGQDHFALRYLRDLAGFLLAHRTSWKSSTWGDLNNHGPGFLAQVERS
jgi:arylsulfatase A-like enzyme